jgi:hypothetical protein
MDPGTAVHSSSEALGQCCRSSQEDEASAQDEPQKLLSDEARAADGRRSSGIDKMEVMLLFHFFSLITGWW